MTSVLLAWLSLAAASDPRVLIDDPHVVAALEPELGFRRVLAEEGRADLTLAVAAELETLAAAWPSTGVGVGHRHRLFDVRWLSRPDVDFVLVALVNRMDRAARSGGCGELRALYRLMRAPSQPLPMTAALSWAYPARDCAVLARRWLLTTSVVGAALSEHARRELIPAGPPERLEVNLQVRRSTSLAFPQLGGRADYLLRAFRVTNRRLTAIALEDTPAASAASWLSSAARREALAAQRTRLPDELARFSAFTVLPQRAAHPENTPFAELLGVQAPSLERRSCQGCHSAGSLAGFHYLGPADAAPFGLGVGISPRMRAELEARLRQLVTVANGAPPAPIDVELPSPSLPRGAVGAPCAPGGCEDGATCELPLYGFPDGMCSGDCGVVDAETTCAPLPAAAAFDGCLSRGRSMKQCLAEASHPTRVRACDEAAPCREGYVCARLTASTRGCVPSYFLPELRVDGHEGARPLESSQQLPASSLTPGPTAR